MRSSGLSSLLLVLFIVCFSYATCPLKPDPPATAICGVTGSFESLNKYHTITSGEADSLQSCINFLNNAFNPKKPHGRFNTVPRSLSFNHDNKNCTLYKRASYREGFAQSSNSSTVYYDGSCFECPSPCAQKGNRLLNGGFQLSSKSLLPWLDNNASLSSNGYNSSQSYFSDIKDQPYSFAELSQLWRGCPGQFYSMSFKVLPLHQNPPYPVICPPYSYYGCKPGLLSLVDSTEVNYVRSPYAQPNTTWGSPYLTFQFTQYDAFEPLFGLLFYADGYVDDVAITPIDPPKPAPRAKELLQNPGFETGKTDPWEIDGASTYYGYVKVVSPGLSGSSYALRFSHEGYGYVQHTITQVINTTVGALYVLRLEGILKYGQTSFGAIVDDGDNQDSVYSWVFLDYTSAEPGKLYTFERSYRAESSPAVISFYAESNSFEGSDRNVTVLMDNFSFKRAADD